MLRNGETAEDPEQLAEAVKRFENRVNLYCGCLLRVSALGAAVAEFSQIPKRVGEQEDFNYPDP